MSAGAAHGCAIQARASLYCWGFDYDGRLGLGQPTAPQPPVQVGTATDWSDVSAGGGHTCGIRAGGALYCWGANTAGEVGDGTVTQRNSPTRIGTATWRQVSAGYTHTCAIRAMPRRSVGARTPTVGWVTGRRRLVTLRPRRRHTRPGPR